MQCEGGYQGTAIIQTREERQIPSGIVLLLLSPVLFPEGDVLTTSNTVLLSWGLCSNVTATGPQGPLLYTQGYTRCPDCPTEEGGPACALRTQSLSLSLCSLFHFLSSFLTSCVQSHPLPPLDRKGQDNGADCSLHVLRWLSDPGPQPTKPAINFNYCQCFCLSTYFSPQVAFCPS